MEPSERAKQMILLRSRRRCECKSNSHTHPDKKFVCGRELRDNFFFVPLKHYSLHDDDFIVICSTCNRENRLGIHKYV